MTTDLTFNTAVSVQWWGQKSDCNRLKKILKLFIKKIIKITKGKPWMNWGKILVIHITNKGLVLWE